MTDLKENNDVMASIVGRTILAAEYTDSNTGEWGDHGEFVLTLDDGRTVEFTSTGYDASQVWVDVRESA